MLRWSLFAFALTCIAAAASPARADLLTSNTIAFPSVVTFDDQGRQSAVKGFVQVGDAVDENIFVMQTDTTGEGLYFSQPDWDLAGNGSWGSPKTFVGMKDFVSVFIFQFFDAPVSAVGGFLNYAPGSALPLGIMALDASRKIIESYVFAGGTDIFTPGGYNAGAFRGIQRTANDIVYFGVAGGPGTALDDLTFTRIGTATAPERVAAPAAVSFFLIGFAGVTGKMRRRRAPQA